MVAFGAASGEMVAPFPANERATASCRAEAHRSVFELQVHALGTPGTASSSLCARVMSDPGLRCVIAAASMRCRLARAEVHARGACDLARADACEACVMRALAGASASREKKTSPARTASSRAANVFSDATVVHGREETRDEISSRAERDREAFSSTTLPPAMEWQVYLAELDAVRSECRHAEDAWRAEAAASALAKVLEKARDAEKAADARDAASRKAAEDVLAEVQEARAAAADASTKITSVAAQTEQVAASMRAWRADAEAFIEAHGETLRGIETQSESMRAFVEATATKVDAFVAFAGSQGQTAWATIQTLRRDMSRSRDAIEAAAAAGRRRRATAADGDAFRLVFVRGPLVALWRLARLAARSAAFAWRVVVKAHALLSRVVPARYRVLAGAAAAAAAARRRRRSRENQKKTRANTREAFDSFRSEHAEVLAELRALRRETAERALFEPRRRASARRASEEDAPSVLRGDEETKTKTKTKQKKSGRQCATTRARARR